MLTSTDSIAKLFLAIPTKQKDVWCFHDKFEYKENLLKGRRLYQKINPKANFYCAISIE